jgi:CRP-like cAMP-binding protein
MRLLLRYTQALTDADGADGGMQPPSFARPAAVPLAAALSLDRLPSNELIMTQELIANMLGVRREGVTEAAGSLQRAGMITFISAGTSPYATGRLWRRAAASATQWSGRSSSVCSPR